MKLKYCIIAFFLMKVVQGNQQDCKEFENVDFFINGLDEPVESYYTCKMTAELDDVFGGTEINTEANKKTNFDVKAVEIAGYQSGLIIKFIPFSIFKTFPFIEYLSMVAGEPEFEVLKPGYFTGAENLKVLVIKDTAIKELTENLFAEAISLEYINLQRNMIHTIDKFAFKDTFLLRGLYLDNNAIKYLNPKTFSHLENLEILSLRDNVCIDMQFEIVNGDFSRVEEEIRANCTFEFGEDWDVLVAESVTKGSESRNKTDTEHRNANFTVSNDVISEDKFEDLQFKLNSMEENYIDLVEKFATLTKKSEITEKTHQEQIASLENKHFAKSQELEGKIDSLKEEIEFLKETGTSTVSPASDESLEKTIKSLIQNDIDLLLKFEENFNTTQKQINEILDVSQPVEGKNECCNKNSKSLKDVSLQLSSFRKDASGMVKKLEIRIAKSENEVKALKTDNAKINIEIDKLDKKLV